MCDSNKERSTEIKIQPLDHLQSSLWIETLIPQASWEWGTYYAP